MVVETMASMAALLPPDCNLAIFVLVSNLIGLVPGFFRQPPTSTLRQHVPSSYSSLLMWLESNTTA